MTYGNARNTSIDETVRPCPMFPDMEQRRLYENKILTTSSTSNYIPVVVRPGFVYGGQGGPIADMFFGQKLEEDLILHGTPDKRWSWVHVHDLGEGYVTIAKSPISIVANQQYNLVSLPFLLLFLLSTFTLSQPLILISNSL
jgi:UDP-glucose 4-epimerase